MKKIITQVEPDSIYLDNLVGNEIVAYKCKGNTHAILRKTVAIDRTRINKYIFGFGFINLSYPGSSASFVSETNMKDSIKKAIASGREVFVFNNEKDFCLAIVDNLF